jgi:integrase
MPKPAARVRLIDRSVAALEPVDGKRVTVFDAVVAGLALRCTERGAKSFLVITNFHGKQRWVTLGRYPVLGLKEARDRAREVLAKVGRGEDPGAKPKTPAEPDSFATIAARFVTEYAQPRNRSWRESERIFRVYCARWSERDITLISRRDVRELLERVAREHGPIMANRVLAAVRKLFAWAAERDIVSASPAAGVRPVAKENSRDRVLNDGELRLFWRATGEMRMPWGQFFRVLALTGQRRSEVARMRWADIDLDRAVWTLPRELTKTDRAHEVPLSAPVLDILGAMPRFSGPFVFTTGNGNKPISDFTGAKEALDRAMPAGTPPWTNHDLRRTFATVSARLGIPPHIVEKALNHSSGSIRGVAAVYNRHGYEAEKRRALEAWARHLVGLADGGKVVPLIRV